MNLTRLGDHCWPNQAQRPQPSCEMRHAFQVVFGRNDGHDSTGIEVWFTPPVFRIARYTARETPC